jgi:WD40 repeat protein
MWSVNPGSIDPQLVLPGGQAHSDIVRGFDVNFDSGVAVSGGEDGQISIWNISV